MRNNDGSERRILNWLGWLAASISAGMGGTFTIMVYAHSNFADKATVTALQSRPRVSREEYTKDIEQIQKQLDYLIRSQQEILIELRKR